MLHIIPKYLYKYKSLGRKVDVERTIDVIKTGSIFISPLEKLNDPMEGKAVLPTMLGYAGISITRAVEELPSKLSKDLEPCRVLSLTETPTSPQMWAYYADGYKGVCLQFGMIPFEVEPIRYAPRSYRVDGIAVDSKDGSDIARARLFTKHADWSHEFEWRAVFMGDETGEYVSMGEHNPQSVILGHKCDEAVARMITSVCEERRIPVYQTYLSDWEFCVRIVPFGFAPARNGVPLYNQVQDECMRRKIPMVDVW